MDWFRFIPIVCDVNKETVEGERFSKSESVMENGETTFDGLYNPHHEKVYRTVFGPYIRHNGVVYADCDYNYNKAITRLTTIAGSDLAEESKMKINQEKFYKNNHILEDYIGQVRNRFILLTDSLDCYQQFEEYVYAPHPKKRARVAAFTRLLSDTGTRHHTFVNVVQGKMKLAEWAKPNKYPRLINDFTVVGSLLGGFVSKLIKTAMEGRINLNGASCFFVTPDNDNLKQAFEYIWANDNEPRCIYYSDDSVIAYDGRVYNTDISSCDRSNHQCVFDKVCEIVPSSEFREYLLRTVDQCRLPLTMKREKNGKPVRVTLRPTECVVYSGTVLTTLINNVASMAVFSAVATHDGELSERPLEAGYKTTGLDEPCERLEDVQFLKYSCTVTDTGYNPWLNLGVILRTIGNCKQDLPGRGDLVARARNFNYSLVRALVHSGRHSIMDDLRDVFSHGKTVSVESSLPYFQFTGGEVPIAGILSRYKCDHSEYGEFISLLRDSGFGDTLACAFTRKVMALDYGL